MLGSFLKRDAKEVRLVAESKLFDSEMYCATTGIKGRLRAAAHYVRRGWKSSKNPSVYFDSKWYLSQYDDVRSAGMCPLVHFLRYGSAEHRSTSAFFDVDRLRANASVRADNVHPIFLYIEDPSAFRKTTVRLFDRDYYLSKAAERRLAVSGEPFRHFMLFGWKEQIDPHPLFSINHYLESYPDIAKAGVNPLYHYMYLGGAELRAPHPRFDVEYYIKQIPDWDNAAIKNPLVHFLSEGVKMGASPAADFDVNYYLQKHADVRQAGMNPFVHYVLHGTNEGREAVNPRKASNIRDLAIRKDSSLFNELGTDLPPISIVIPTYNRRRVLEATLVRCFELPDSERCQFIIVNDGSTDDTQTYLDGISATASNVDVIHRANGGPASARNLGASIAKHDVILFMGDDIRPTGPDFFKAHQDFHLKRSSVADALVGKIVWPSGAAMPITPVMRRIQGRGGEQFGFADLTPYTWLDWRFFYTSNISIKKDAVADWLSGGFADDFKLYGFEDIEFAYRLGKSEAGIRIFYDPTSEGEHIHPYEFEKFVQRQLNTGRMARTFIELHEETAPALGLSPFMEALKSDNRSLQNDATDILAIFEGTKGWINYLERNQFLGNSGFHDDLMGAFFEFAFYVGFTNAAQTATENTGAALNLAFGNFVTKMRRSLRHEVTSHENIFPIAL